MWCLFRYSLPGSAARASTATDNLSPYCLCLRAKDSKVSYSLPSSLHQVPGEFEVKLTDYLALYAAVLSTTVFFWNVEKSRPKFTVLIVGGVKGIHPDAIPGVYVLIRNTSTQTVHIRGMSPLAPHRHISLLERFRHGLRYRRFRYVGWVHYTYALEGVETGLPASIEARNSHSIFIPEQTLWSMLEDDKTNKFAVSVQDALWRNTMSKPFIMKHWL